MKLAQGEVEKLIRVAHESLQESGKSMGCTKVTRLCRFYARSIAPTRHQGFVPWFMGQLDVSPQDNRAISASMYRRLGYADPTGEEATRNVMREGGLTKGS